MLCGELMPPMMPRKCLHGFQSCLATNNHAGQQVIVSAQVLRGGMQHVVDPVIDGSHVVGRGQRGVDQSVDLMLVPQIGELVPNRQRSNGDSSATR